MKTKPFLGLLILGLLFGAGARAQTLEVVLDLQVRGGKFEDVSSYRRPVVQKKLETRDQSTSVIVPESAARIAYKQGDPLFQSGVRTWLLRCKLQAESPAGYYPLLGQWKASSNERIIALILKGGAPGALSFHLSPDGRIEKQVVRALPEPPPLGVWLTVAAQYKPGAEVVLLAFDDEGKLLGRAKGGPVAPAAVLAAPVDFELGGPSKAGFQVSAVQVWNGVLTEEQIVKRGLPALGAK